MTTKENNHSNNNSSNVNKGFASMDKEEVRNIASKGGKASQRSSYDDDTDRNENQDDKRDNGSSADTNKK